MRFVEYVPFVFLTIAAVFFIPAVTSEGWPQIRKLAFSAVMGLLLFFVLGVYWLQTGEKADETFMRWALCGFLANWERCQDVRAIEKGVVIAHPAPVPGNTIDSLTTNASKNPELKRAFETAWMRVCTSVTSAKQAKTDLESNGFGVNTVVLQIVPMWSQTPQCYSVTHPIPLRLFGCNNFESAPDCKYIGYEDALARAKKIGAVECPWELAPALRKAVTTQTDGDAFNLATQPLARPGSDAYDYRLPQIGYGSPRDSSWVGTPFRGNYLSVRRGISSLPPERLLVFCLSASKNGY